MHFWVLINKQPCMILYNTGTQWLNEILNGNWIHCVNMFRMDATTFQNLYFDLETQYRLKPLRRISVIVKVGMFLYTLTLGASNREIYKRFQHFSETLSRYFNKVLNVMFVITWRNKTSWSRFFDNTMRYMSHFKVTYKIIKNRIYLSFLFHYIIHLVIHLQLMFF